VSSVKLKKVYVYRMRKDDVVLVAADDMNGAIAVWQELVKDKTAWPQTVECLGECVLPEGLVGK
jgi:hypothetical protein